MRSTPERRSIVVLLTVLFGCAPAAPPAPSSRGLPVLFEDPTWWQDPDQSDATLGSSATLACDLDGDGWNDLVAGAPGWDGDQVAQGAVFVWEGFDLDLSDDPRWVIAGSQAFGELGAAVACAGDTDSDGYDDLLVGAPGWDRPTAGDSGAAFVFAGGPDGPSATPRWTAVGPWTDAHLGAALGVVDSDADGFDDLVLGFPGDEVTAGGVRLHFGTASGPTPLAGWTWSPGQPGDAVGRSVAGVGDTDGDGYDDLLVGAPGVDDADVGVDAGAASLFGGGPAGPGDVPLWTASADEAGEQAGWAVAGAGDTDGDGFDDLLVGSPTFGGGGSQRGRARLFGGAAGGPADSPTWEAVGSEDGGRLGFAVVGLGDSDGDSFDDFAVGAPWADGPQADAGSVLAFAGGAPPSSEPAVVLTGTVPLERFGSSLGGGGDVDRDGFPDLLVGSPGAGASVDEEGRVTLFRGRSAAADADGDGFCAALPCDDPLEPGDCDDTRPEVNPAAAEICDGLDTDCDGVLLSEELDADGDGIAMCAGDCDDESAGVHPGAAELCDAIDQDCDGDLSDAPGMTPWFNDADGDGHGGADDDPQWTCGEAVEGRAPTADDCDDSDPEVSPSHFEIGCNDKDDDCREGTIDIADGDGDSFTPCGDCTDLGLGPWIGCGDCDDTDRLIHPSMGETCSDGIDQDCDGVDEECFPPPPCFEPDNRCEDPSCSQAGGSGPLSLLAVLLLAVAGSVRRARRSCVAALPVLAVAFCGLAPAHAVEADFDTQLLHPSFAPWGWLGTAGADPGLAESARMGVVMQYEYGSMALFQGPRHRRWVIEHRTTATIGGFLTPLDGLGFGFSLPLSIQKGDWEAIDLPPAVVGDLRSEFVWNFLALRVLHLALTVDWTWPTSTEGGFAGERDPVFEPGVAAQFNAGRVTFLTALETSLRAPVHTGYDVTEGIELALLAGVRVWPKTDRFAISLEVESRTLAARFLQGGSRSPAEVRVGLRVRPHRAPLQLDAAVAAGLGGGIGAPVIRGLLALTVIREPRGAEPLEGVAHVRRRPEEVDDLLGDLASLERPVRRAPPPPAESEAQAVVSSDPPPRRPLAELAGDQIVLGAPIEFEHDRDVLLPSSYPVLDAVVAVFAAHPRVAHVLVEGHASVEGTVTYNWDLSNRRANAVFRYLVEAGVHPTRLSYRGMGEAISVDGARAGRVVDADRRVEFRVIRELSEWTDRIPDWESEAIPVPWSMPEEEEAEDPALEPSESEVVR